MGWKLANHLVYNCSFRRITCSLRVLIFQARLWLCFTSVFELPGIPWHLGKKLMPEPIVQDIPAPHDLCYTCPNCFRAAIGNIYMQYWGNVGVCMLKMKLSHCCMDLLAASPGLSLHTICCTLAQTRACVALTALPCSG